jgi:hypothetical protein
MVSSNDVNVGAPGERPSGGGLVDHALRISLRHDRTYVPEVGSDEVLGTVAAGVRRSGAQKGVGAVRQVRLRALSVTCAPGVAPSTSPLGQHHGGAAFNTAGNGQPPKTRLEAQVRDGSRLARSACRTNEFASLCAGSTGSQPDRVQIRILT